MSDGNKSEEAICSLQSLRNFLEDMQAKRSPCYDHDLTGGYVAANIVHASKGAAYHLPGLRQAIDHLIEERLMTEEPERSELKAGQGEAVAEVISAYGDPEAFGEREVKVLADLSKIPYGTKLYTAPPASADAVSVPRNIALRMAADAAQYDHEHAVVNDNVQLWQQPNARVSLTVGDLRTVRALLAQSQEVKS